jgi:acetyl esterase/lipase
MSERLPTDVTTSDDIAAYRRAGEATRLNAEEIAARFGLSSRELEIDGTPVTALRASASETSGRVVFLHGGGLIAGTRTDGLDVVARHAADLVLEVWSVEYPLAPEHSFDDMVAAALRVLSAAGADATRVLIAGQSAGGAVAAASALASRQTGVRIDGQLLICPMLSRRPTASKRQHADDPSWSARSNATGWDVALAGSRMLPPGERDDLSGLPPTYLDSGSAELFRDDIVAFASALWVHGVSTELHVWSGGFHSFDGVVETAIVSVEAHRARREWIRRWLHGEL